MGGLFGKRKTCCCGNCIVPCCPGFNIEDAVLNNEGKGPGSLGCPDIVEERGPVYDNGWRMAVVGDEDAAELFGEEICAAFRTDGYVFVLGLIGIISFEVIVACVGNGSSVRGFIRYNAYPSDTIPKNEWIEIEAGWECPNCKDLESGTPATAYLYFDALMDCSFCNTSDYVYGPPDICSPDTIWSVRYYFSGYGTCL